MHIFTAGLRSHSLPHSDHYAHPPFLPKTNDIRRLRSCSGLILSACQGEPVSTVTI